MRNLNFAGKNAWVGLPVTNGQQTRAIVTTRIPEHSLAQIQLRLEASTPYYRVKKLLINRGICSRQDGVSNAHALRTIEYWPIAADPCYNSRSTTPL